MDVNVETIRYYQRRGLLREPEKPLGGHRRYSGNEASCVRFIKRAQVLGFILEEIDRLLRLEGADCCADTRKFTARKLILIEAKLADLTAMRNVLAGLVKQFLRDGRQCGVYCSCVLILAWHAHSAARNILCRQRMTSHPNYFPTYRSGNCFCRLATLGRSLMTI